MLSEKLGLSISKKLFNKTSTKRTSPTVKKLSKTSLNFMALPRIARDLNIIRQNIIKLIKVYGGDASEKEDMHVLKDDERERKFKVLQDKFIDQNTKSEDDEKSSKGKLFKKFKDLAKTQIKKLKEKLLKLFERLKKFAKELFGKIKDFAKNAFKYIEEAFEKYLRPMMDKLKDKLGKKMAKMAEKSAVKVAFRGLAAAAGPIGWIALIILTLWDGLTDAWDTWQETGDLYETVKAGIAGLVDSLTFGLFDKENAKKVIDGTIDFVKNIPDKIFSFIDDAANFISKFAGNIIDKIIESNPFKVNPPSEKEVADSKKAAEEKLKADAEKQKQIEENLAKAREIIRVKTEERDRLINEVAILEEQAAGKPSESTKQLQEKREELRTSEKGLDDALKREQQAKKEAYAPKPSSPGSVPPPPTTAPTPGAKPPSPSESKQVKISSESGKQIMLKKLDDANVTDATARAAIMAQVGHESVNFTTLSENLNYSTQGLVKTFKKYFPNEEMAQSYAKNPQKIADRVYGGRMGNAPEGGGEGFLYRGRGFIQLTGKDNYKKFGYIGDPEQLTNPQTAADSAVKFILGYKGDWSNIKALTKFVNGGDIGLADRKKHFEEYLNDPKITKAGESPGTKIDAVASAPSGSSMASTSTSVAVGQREQLKPKDVNVVNVSQTNNTKGHDTKTIAAKKGDSNEMATARVT